MDHEPRLYLDHDDTWSVECSCGEPCGLTLDPDQAALVAAPHLREVALLGAS